MQQFLAINQNKGPESLYGKRSGSFVFLVLDAHSSETAARVMDKFKVSQSLSWNQQYPGKDSTWAQVAKLILANLVLVAVLAGFAMAAGLLLFLSRKVAAKWFPLSNWGHPGEDSFIKLNLGP